MKKLLLPFFLAVFLLAPRCSRDTAFLAKLHIVNHQPYADRFAQGPVRPYSFLISAEVPAICNAPWTRSANFGLPGDYFWTAITSFPPPSPERLKNSIKRPTAEERKQILHFLKDHFAIQFQNSTLIDSGQTYTYGCYSSDRHEFYLMLSEGDTVYVISGWFGKFMSFYRAVPYDKRLTPADLIAEAQKIAPGIRKFGLSDSLVNVDTSLVWDQKLYFLELDDNAHHLRLRHYPINVVLPPEDPKTGKERLFNLIEITKMND